jgi:hypothetical protein
MTNSAEGILLRRPKLKPGRPRDTDGIIQRAYEVQGGRRIRPPITLRGGDALDSYDEPLA